LGEQAARIAEAKPDVVCLQEVSPKNAAPWTDLLSAAGLEHIGLAPPAPTRSRPLSVLTAARAPLLEIPIADVP
jgi:endonuclease/exonuclease/phosphatase family metal-dependent hydrolase